MPEARSEPKIQVDFSPSFSSLNLPSGSLETKARMDVTIDLDILIEECQRRAKQSSFLCGQRWQLTAEVLLALQKALNEVGNHD